jgi:hypothetical protein
MKSQFVASYVYTENGKTIFNNMYVGGVITCVYRNFTVDNLYFYSYVRAQPYWMLMQNWMDAAE